MLLRFVRVYNCLHIHAMQQIHDTHDTSVMTIDTYRLVYSYHPNLSSDITNLPIHMIHPLRLPNVENATNNGITHAMTPNLTVANDCGNE